MRARRGAAACSDVPQPQERRLPGPRSPWPWLLRRRPVRTPALGGADVAFFPLTVPFTAGPGTIAVAIALSASRPTDALDLLPYFAGGSLAAAAVAVTVGLCYAAADRVVALLGPAGARVLTRLTAFLLLCIGVQIVLTGVREAVAPLVVRAR